MKGLSRAQAFYDAMSPADVSDAEIQRLTMIDEHVTYLERNGRSFMSALIENDAANLPGLEALCHAETMDELSLTERNRLMTELAELDLTRTGEIDGR